MRKDRLIGPNGSQERGEFVRPGAKTPRFCFCCICMRKEAGKDKGDGVREHGVIGEFPRLFLRWEKD